VVLAVSGGSDSTALLHLFARWRAVAGAPPAIVATVDHGLRPESAAEAAAVGALARRLGIEHATLHWDGDKPAADLQAAARDARYRLLGALAAERGFDAVATAHTEDDQAETLLLRLAHGTGVDGLAAMATARPLDASGAILLLRPLLGLSRARLRATLAAAGLGWSDDPSNGDGRFGRARIRALMPSLAAEGMTAERLAATARRAGRAAAALDAATTALAGAALTTHPGGFLSIDVDRLAAAPEEIGLRLLARAVAAAGAPPAHGPRLDRLESAYEAVLAGPGAERRTLGGAVLDRRGARLWVYREAGRIAAADLELAPGEAGIWDGRFRARLVPAAARPVRIAALGPGARARLGRPARQMPAAALARVPAAFAGDELVAVPAFGLAAGTGWHDAVAIEPIGRIDEGAAP
jgi:tRNA(Ile)-lysidine synthase